MAETKIYYQGTESEIDTWHSYAMDPSQANIAAEGNINMVDGVSKPDNQRTVGYSRKIAHPTNSDDFIIRFGEYPNPGMGLTEYSESEAVSNGYRSTT